MLKLKFTGIFWDFLLLQETLCARYTECPKKNIPELPFCETGLWKATFPRTWFCKKAIQKVVYGVKGDVWVVQGGQGGHLGGRRDMVGGFSGDL